VRRSGQHAAWRPELYRARHRLLKARERLSERERRRLAELFEREPLIAEAWGLKERFRDIYRATNRLDAERRLDAFLATVDRAGLPAFDAFAKGIRIWREELLAYFDEPTTNGYAEGVINKVKVIKRYTAEMIDWLAIYDATTDRCYYIPAAELGSGMRMLSLRLKPPRNSQHRRVRFASRYLEI